MEDTAKSVIEAAEAYVDDPTSEECFEDLQHAVEHHRQSQVEPESCGDCGHPAIEHTVRGYLKGTKVDLCARSGCNCAGLPSSIDPKKVRPHTVYVCFRGLRWVVHTPVTKRKHASYDDAMGDAVATAGTIYTNTGFPARVVVEGKGEVHRTGP